MTRHRRRVRSHAEQMYWDRLTPHERLAFTLGYDVGQGIDFPAPSHIAALRVQLGVDQPPRPKAKRSYTTRRPHARNADGTRFKYDLAQVADIARRAIAAGESATIAVFEQIELCASPEAASMAISAARKAGHDIPYVRPPRSAS